MFFAAIALRLSLAAQAQVYPAKQLRLVVPYPAGGGTDFFARTVGAQLAVQLGQPVVVENRPGAATIIGAEAVAKSAPDGYTLLLGDTATFAVNPSLYKKLPYDPSKDLSPVTMTGRFALLLVVNPAKLKADSVKELVEMAKQASGRIDYASPGPGSPHHLAMEMFKQRTGTQFTHVPYKGAAPAIQDLLSGQVPLMFLDLAAGAPQIKAGKLKALAVASDKRIAALPDLVTVGEAGIDGFRSLGVAGSRRSRKHAARHRRPARTPSTARRSPCPNCARSSSTPASIRCKAPRRTRAPTSGARP